ncbi:MAG: histidinol phosphate phosphatase domain-containing protein [Candidatus Omnitrophica bacterium]|nr:histidinol phosphate phosphatase domain-containing protein [Candidatus Omnitrophota bacterium]
MYNLHSHSLLSDGALLPSEVAVRYLSQGYKVIAITDHADYSNIEFVTDAILKFVKQWPANSGIKVLPGVELTHIPPEQFSPLVKFAKDKGMKIIIGHGETLAEPVVKGTNRAALEAGVDILAHPGLISKEDVELAAKKNIFLEITTRKGHKGTNPHVAEEALKAGARLVINTDSHMPEDIVKPEELISVALSAGLTSSKIDSIYSDVEKFIKEREAR